MKTRNHAITTASGSESLEFSKNIEDFEKLCEKFLADPGWLRELLAMQKCLEGIRQSCAFVDMTFRTLYDRRLYNRAFVQQDIPGFAGLGLPVAYSDEHRFRLQSVRLHRRCCRSPSRM
uniref:Uncharacterized protein n=1 Tax=Parascaris univalens TaxID=6257 RepID=A0A915A312_PARUN